MRCTRCILPDTFAGIEFDGEGVCNYCRDDEKRNSIDWEVREQEFMGILESAKNKAKHLNIPYDCVVPFSGGKDSTYTLYSMVNYGMHPIAVTADHCFFTSTLYENWRVVFSKLNAAHMVFTPSWRVVKNLCAIGLRLTGDFCWHCHLGAFSFPVAAAVRLKIPLVVYGTSDYNLTKDDVALRDKKFWNNLLTAVNGFDPKVDFISGDITRNDMQAFLNYPSDKQMENVFSINQGAYQRWNARKQTEIIKTELGWKGCKVEGSFVDWDNTECKYVGVRDYIKYIRRGFGRTCQLASADIRHGVLSREAALELIEKYDGKRPDSLEDFLADIDMTEKEFTGIAERYKVKPGQLKTAA